MLQERLQPCQSTIIVTLTCAFAGKFREGQFLRLLVKTRKSGVDAQLVYETLVLAAA